ncbi:MAG TPA: DUF533 domain-containing protein [Gammaproteobacteria bacterium]|nr:DUF533 domain-containing protein [Gammaproteobacteria bacterium]
MDAQALLEDLLQSGKKLAAQGQEIAEDKLDVPEAGTERDAMLSGMGKGALAAGALALLLGTKGGRRLGGAALKLGSVAAIGGVAYNAYQNWQKEQGNAEVKLIPINELTGEQADQRSLILLKAMIAAAKADGHIDEQALVIIKDEMIKLGLGKSAVDFFRDEARKPLDVKDIAAEVSDLETAGEVYLASKLLLDLDNSEEKDYLDQLILALNLDADFIVELDRAVV